MRVFPLCASQGAIWPHLQLLKATGSSWRAQHVHRASGVCNVTAVSQPQSAPAGPNWLRRPCVESDMKGGAVRVRGPEEKCNELQQTGPPVGQGVCFNFLF